MLLLIIVAEYSRLDLTPLVYPRYKLPREILGRRRREQVKAPRGIWKIIKYVYYLVTRYLLIIFIITQWE